MDDVREAFAGVGDLDGGASDELHRARQALKHALYRKRGCDAKEARRIGKIFDRATNDILGTRWAFAGVTVCRTIRRRARYAILRSKPSSHRLELISPRSDPSLDCVHR